MRKIVENLFFPFRLFTTLSLGFLLGVGIASFINLDWTRSWPIFVLALILFLSLAFINFLYRNSYLSLISFGLIFIVLGLASFSLFAKITTPTIIFGDDITFSGGIVSRPVIDSKKQSFIFKIDDEKSPSLKILVELPVFPVYHYADKLKLIGTITEPTNFGDFDYKSYLRRQLVFGIVKNPEIEIVNREKSWPEKLVSTLYSVSASFERSLNRIISEPEASLASGILLGVKRNIPDDLLDWLNRAGLTHIIALSGYNVTIIIAMLSAVMILWFGRRRTFWFGTLLVLAFVVMTGGSASVERAAIFSLLILFGKTIGRQGDQTNLMLLAATIMVIANPYILRYDIGFQLSFLAFAGLIYFSPFLKKYFEKSRMKNWPEGIRLTFAETLGAQIAVSPILFFQFHRLSLIAPVSNILILWMMPYAMAMTAIAALFGIIYYPLGKIAGLLLWPAMAYIIKITELCAKIPFSSFQFK